LQGEVIVISQYFSTAYGAIKVWSSSLKFNWFTAIFWLRSSAGTNSTYYLPNSG